MKISLLLSVGRLRDELARNGLDIELVSPLLSAHLKYADEPPSHCAEVTLLFRTPALGLVAPEPLVYDFLSSNS